MLAFWFAYVATRPLGASIADWLGKPTTDDGVGLGSGPVSLVLAIGIAVFVAYRAISRRDVQSGRDAGESPVLAEANGRA